MAPKFLMFYLLLSLLFCDLVSAFWWSLGSRAVMDHSRICRKRGRKLSKDPLSAICRREPATVKLILRGTQSGMMECQHQFRHHRWNCTDNRRSLRRIFSRDSPETAFLNSIISAAVTHEITAACSRGDLLQCSCSKNAYETTETDYSNKKSRNERKRRKEARAVIAGHSPSSRDGSLQERETHRKGKKRKGRKQRRRKLSKEEKKRRRLNRKRERNRLLSNSLDNSLRSQDGTGSVGDGEVAVTLHVDGKKIADVPVGGAAGGVGGGRGRGGSGGGLPGPVGVIGEDWHWSGCDDNVGFGYRIARDFMDGKFLRGHGSQDIKSIIMLRNNEAGRLSVRNHLRPHCKCHGLSGSCAHQTCWKRMPTFRNVGERLKEKFIEAVKVIPSNDGVTIIPATESIRAPTEEDLVYLDDSPDFCHFNRRTGSLGTEGRNCNASAVDSSGCESMCCGRRYQSQIRLMTENCHCRFKFCCEVTCQKCEVKREFSYCT